MSKKADNRPTYSNAARAAMAKLYSPLQNLTIFVEDDSMQEVYNALIKRMKIENLRFHSVIPLGGKENVINHAKEHINNFDYCYIVDGDFDFILNKNSVCDNRVFRLNKYCFENYLFNENACCMVVYEQLGNKSEREVSECVSWPSFSSNIEKKLVPLFMYYIVAKYHAPSVRTVGGCFGSLVRSERGRCVLDEEKIQRELDRIKEEILKEISEKELEDTLEVLNGEVQVLPNKTDIISGKDCLFKLLSDHIAHCSSPIQSQSLKMRLTISTEIENFYDLREHIIACAKSRNDTSLVTSS